MKSIDAHILDESTWLNSWQQYIEPTEILPNIVIKPAWQEYDNEQNKTISKSIQIYRLVLVLMKLRELVQNFYRPIVNP